MHYVVYYVLTSNHKHFMGNHSQSQRVVQAQADRQTDIAWIHPENFKDHMYNECTYILETAAVASVSSLASTSSLYTTAKHHQPYIVGTKGTAAILPAIDRMLKNEEYLVSNINNLSCIHITALPTLSAIIPHRQSTVRAFRPILFVTCLPTNNSNNDRAVPSAPTTMSKSTLQIQHAYKTHRFWLFGVCS